MGDSSSCVQTGTESQTEASGRCSKCPPPAGDAGRLGTPVVVMPGGAPGIEWVGTGMPLNPQRPGHHPPENSLPRMSTVRGTPNSRGRAGSVPTQPAS